MAALIKASADPPEIAPETVPGGEACRQDSGGRRGTPGVDDEMVQKTSGGPVCGSCGAENRPGARWCASCGAALAEIRSCPRCGTENRPEARFCRACGAPLDAIATPLRSRRSATVLRRRWLGVAAATVAVVVAVAFGVRTWLQPGEDKTASPQRPTEARVEVMGAAPGAALRREEPDH
jgi:ribosomal protein L40E